MSRISENYGTIVNVLTHVTRVMGVSEVDDKEKEVEKGFEEMMAE